MRKDRIASVLEKEIANIIAQKMGDPRLGFVTITRVQVSPDLKNATIYFSSLEDKKADHVILNKAKGFIRSLLAQRVRIRNVPDLYFKIDDTFEYGQKIEGLIKKISKNNKTE